MKKYSNFRGKIKTGDLFFTASRSIVSRIIRFFTRSAVSHVGVFMWSEGRLLIVEARAHKGVSMTPATDRISQESTCWWGRLDSKIRTIEEIKETIWSELGEEYDTLGAIVSLFYDTHSSKRFCSEFSAKVVGIEFPEMSRGVTPGDLRISCLQNFHLIK